MLSDAFQAIRRNDPRMSEFLAGIREINERDEDGQSLLHEAVSANNATAARKLIALGINVNAQDNNGQTPLHYASLRHATELAAEILAHGGDCSITDVHGNTPLWTAVFNARTKYETVKVIAANCDLELAKIKNKHGRSPIDFARQIGDDTLLQLIDPENLRHA